MMLIIPKENETYELYIQRILDSRKNIKDENEYQEKHHIVPKCMDGSNDKDNLIYLYAQEHYYAHKLLALENPENYGCVAAWHKMQNPVNANQQRRYVIEAEEYAQARKMFSKLHSERMRGKNNPNYGKVFTQEWKDKITAHKNWASICKRIKNLETGLEFDSCTEAARWCNMSDCSSIVKNAKGKRKSAGKHPETGEKLHWEYIE